MKSQHVIFVLFCGSLLNSGAPESKAAITLTEITVEHGYGATPAGSSTDTSSVTFISTSPEQSHELFGEETFGPDGDMPAWTTEAVANNQGAFYNRALLNDGLAFDLTGNVIANNMLSPSATVAYAPTARLVNSQTLYTAKFQANDLPNDFSATFHVSETTLAVTQVQGLSNASAAAGFEIFVGPDANNLTSFASGFRSLASSGTVFTNAIVPDGVSAPSLGVSSSSTYAFAGLSGFEDTFETRVERFAPLELTLPISPSVLGPDGSFVVRYFEFAQAQSFNQGSFLEDERELGLGAGGSVPDGSLSPSGFPFSLHAFAETGDPFSVDGAGAAAQPFVGLIEVTSVPEPSSCLLISLLAFAAGGTRWISKLKAGG